MDYTERRGPGREGVMDYTKRAMCPDCGMHTEPGECRCYQCSDIMVGLIRTVCSEMAEFLIEKNKSYGNSVAEPVNVFSQMEPLDQIDVRMDDKLSRIMRGKPYKFENDERDLAGYLLLKIATSRYLKAVGGDGWPSDNSLRIKDVMDYKDIVTPDEG